MVLCAPMPCLGQRMWVARGEGAVEGARQWGGQWAASPSRHQRRCAATSRGSRLWSGACPAVRWQHNRLQPRPLFVVPGTAHCLLGLPRPLPRQQPHTGPLHFLAGLLPRHVCCPSLEHASLQREERQGFPSTANSKALWSQSVSKGIGVLLALPAGIPSDHAVRAQVCPSGGAVRCGALDSCQAVGMGNRIHAEGGGLISPFHPPPHPTPPKKSKFHQIFSLAAIIRWRSGRRTGKRVYNRLLMKYVTFYFWKYSAFFIFPCWVCHFLDFHALEALCSGWLVCCRFFLICLLGKQMCGGSC